MRHPEILSEAQKITKNCPLLKMQSLTKEVSNVLDYLVVPFNIQLQKHKI